VYVGLKYAEPLPYEFWRHILAEKFGCTPMDIDQWPAREYVQAVAIINAINKAGGLQT